MNKLIVLIITRIIEFTVVGVVATFLWGGVANSMMRLIAVFAVIGVYCVYLGVTLANDVRVMKYGEGEPLE